MQRTSLCGAHVGDEAPHRLTRAARGQVPRRVDDRADCHVHDALLRPKPAQLRVVGQGAREAAEIRGDLIHVPPDHEVVQRRAGRRLHLVTAPDGEGEPMTGLPAGLVGTQ